MPGRLLLVLLAFALLAPVAFSLHPAGTYAQSGSPVPIELVPTDIPVPGTTNQTAEIDPAGDLVMPAEFAGNTPPGSYSSVPIYARSDVYFFVYEITIGGQTDVIDGTNGNGVFDAPGYRTDNAKVLTVVTTAVHNGNFLLCIIFDGLDFANVSAVQLMRSTGGTWTPITSERNVTNVCGYTPELGTFAVVEPGTNPPTATSTSVSPTDTATPSNTATEMSTATESPTLAPTVTDTPSASSTATELPSATSSVTRLPTETPTVTPSPTSTLSPTTLATATETATHTSTSTPSETAPSTLTPTASSTVTPSDTATSTATATQTATATETATSSPSPTSTVTLTPSETATSTLTATATETSTSAPSRIQFALPNVFVSYPQIPTSGTTSGVVLSGSELPSLPGSYLTSNAWFFAVSSTVGQTGNKQLCVNFETATYTDPHRLVLLQRAGSSWAALPNQILDTLLPEQGTHCGYVAAFGDFALVERAPATATVTATPSRTPSPTSTIVPSSTRTATSTATGTATSTATSTLSPTQTATATATATPTATHTFTATATSTATLSPGSFATGTILRTTTRVNLRSGASTSTGSLGVLSSGVTVTVTGPSMAAGGLLWVPVTSSLGAGWVASRYLVPVSTATPTRTAAPPTITRTPDGSTPTRTPSRTPTRPTGGLDAGDSVRTTTNVNLRSGPGTSSTVLRVVPSQTVATVTGPGVVSGGITFYPVTISGYPSGFLAGAYLQRITATAVPSRTRTATATVVGSTVRYTTNNVNLRRGPGTSYGIVATIPQGTRVNITGTPQRISGTDWYPIIVNGVGSGWMSGAFLTALPPL